MNKPSALNSIKAILAERFQDIDGIGFPFEPHFTQTPTSFICDLRFKFEDEILNATTEMAPAQFEQVSTNIDAFKLFIDFQIDCIRNLCAKSFYASHYEIHFCHVFGSKRTILGKGLEKICRFCGRSKPSVSFRSKAHAVPESTGNCTLFSHYECDHCNEIFGKGIEQDFGCMTNPQRTFFKVKGKGGVPSLKVPGTTIKVINDVLQVQQLDSGNMSFDPTGSFINFSIPLPPFIPRSVAKTFVKIALTVMDFGELEMFKEIIPILKNNHAEATDATLVVSTFYKNAKPGTVYLLRRVSNESKFPYMLLGLELGRQGYQVAIPCAKNQDLKTRFIPICFTDNDYSSARLLDLSSLEDRKVGVSDLSNLFYVLLGPP